MKTIEQITQIAESLGWTIDIGDPANNSSAALFKFDDIVILFMPFMSDNPAMVLKTKIFTKSKE